MEKRRDSRHEMSNLSPSAAGNSSGVVQDRISFRLSQQSELPVADGFRPASPLSSPGTPAPQESRPGAVRTSSTPQPPPSARNSISKSGPVGIALSQEPEASAESGGLPFDPNTSRFNRPSSSASSAYDATSPYHARISRISFSYPRRPSTALSSHAIRPVHPYALYRQTTFEEEADEPVSPVTAAPITSAPVGFPPNSANFRRRVGPNGEELDIVGPDGHLEQLPPYSRYPQAGPIRKEAVESPVPATAGESSSANSQPVQGPSQINDPSIARGQSPPTQSSPQSQTPPPTSQQSEPRDSRTLRSSASSLAEMKDNEQAANQKKKQRLLCGAVPLWAVLLFAFLCIFLAVIAGGVIGGMLSQQRQRNRTREDPRTITMTNQQMWDATPIPVPTGIPPLPSGTFFFPLGAPGEQERRCIEPSRDMTAWACSVANQLLLIDFSNPSRYPQAKIYPAPSAPGMEGIQYGPQPPRLNSTQSLIWVTDLQDPGRGPALHFQNVYDKVVIIEGERFPSPELHLRNSDKKPRHRRFDDPVKREYTGPPPSIAFDPSKPPRHRFASTPGEEPWYCYWNSTFIEGFIYIQQPIPGAETQQFTASSPTTEPMPSTTISNTVHPFGAPITSAIHAVSETPPASASAPLQARSPAKPSSITQQKEVSPPAPTSPPLRFPFIVKIEERRLPNPEFTPFCQRMIVRPNGVTEPKLDKHGQNIIEIIKEAPGGKSDAQVTAGVTPGQSSHQKKGYQQNGRSKARRSWEYEVTQAGHVVRRNVEPGNSCHCQWVSPYG